MAPLPFLLFPIMNRMSLITAIILLWYSSVPVCGDFFQVQNAGDRNMVVLVIKYVSLALMVMGLRGTTA